MHNSSSAHYPKFMNAFVNEWDGFDPDATVNENIEKWLLEVPEDSEGNKVDPDDIERIREIMLPGYADGELKKDKLIPHYTADDEWQSDDLAGWQVAKEDDNVKCNWHRHDATPCTICGYGAEEPQGSSEQPASSQPAAEDFTQVISHVWTVTKTENNSDGKPYEQLSDAEKGKVGVRILTRNISSTSIASFDSEGKLPTEENQSVTYQIKAPKAGTYQMIMCGRVSNSSYMLSKRGIKVTLNGESVSIDGENRDGGLNGTGDNEFVVCPAMDLTGNEDTITITCRYYRIAFALDAYVTFAEH